MTDRYDLRTVAEAASDAWDTTPESHKPILRDCSDALVQAADELDRLQAIESEYNACRDEVVRIASRESAMAEQLTRERDEARTDAERERRYYKEHTNEYIGCISQMYQIAEGPNRNVDGNEVEAVRELKRERDEARAIIERLRDAFKTLEIAIQEWQHA